MVILDTDVIIWLLRDHESVGERFSRTVMETEGAVFITPVQMAEVYAGIRPKERFKTDQFMNTLSVIEIDREIGRQAGDYMLTYAKSHNVTLADALMAATVRKTAFRFWTLNKKHYPMFQDDEFYF